MGTDSFEHRLKIGITIKNQALYKWGKSLLCDITAATDGFALWDNVIVQVLQIRYVTDKGAGCLAGYSNAGSCQFRYLVGVGQNDFAHNDFPPDGAFPEGELQLFLAGVDIHEPLNRHDGMRTRHLVVEPVFLINATVPGFPVPSVELQRLSSEAGHIVNVNGSTLYLQTLHIPLIHCLEALELHAVGIGGQFCHLGSVDEWLFMEFVEGLVWGRG